MCPLLILSIDSYVYIFNVIARSTFRLDSCTELPDNRGMADWLKILISALSGVAVGLILEPLKHHFMGRVIARKARRAIYHELGGMYRGFCLTQHESEEFYARCFKHGVLDDGTFWYYRNHYRDAFYGLKEWEPIEDIYSAFRVIKQQVMDGTKSSVAGAADFRE